MDIPAFQKILRHFDIPYFVIHVPDNLIKRTEIGILLGQWRNNTWGNFGS